MAKSTEFFLATGFISEVSGYQEIVGKEFETQFRSFLKENRKLKDLLETQFEIEDIDVAHLKKVEAKRRKNNLKHKIKQQERILNERTWKYKASGSINDYNEMLEAYEKLRASKRKARTRRRIAQP